MTDAMRNSCSVAREERELSLVYPGFYAIN
jgi:hypothetical protein